MKAKAHTVTNQIHSLILQRFRYEVIKDTDMNHDEQMIDVKDEDGEQNEENEKDADNADENSFNTELINEDDRSSVNH